MRLDALIGERLGRYQIEALIGRGGMAAVYRAFDPALQRAVALKVLYPQYLADADLVERFRREAVTAAGLDHPNIAPIYDVGEVDGLVYLTMKLLPGPSLAELLQREGRLPLAQLATIADEIASALDEAHKEGIVHRDIKPGNVIFDRHGRALLTDFGIAKSLESASLTESSVLIGTPDYIAPEQIDSRLAPGGQIDCRADIYALGALLYRAITGRRPFEGTPQSVLLAHLRDEPSPPSALVPGLPAVVDAVLARAMAKEPSARYASAGELARDFEAALGDTTAIGAIFPAAAIRGDAATPPATGAPVGGRPATGQWTPPVVATIDAGRRRRTTGRPAIALATLAALIVLGALLFRFVARAAAPEEIASTANVLPRSTAQMGITPAAIATATETPSPSSSPPATPSIDAIPAEEGAAAQVDVGNTAPPATATATAGLVAEALPAPTAFRPAAPTSPPASAAPSATTRPPAPTATRPPTAPTATNPPPPPTATQPPPPPTATQPPPPTATQPPPPTVEPTPEPVGCSVPMQGGFGRLWDNSETIQAQLGCPLRAEAPGPAAEQIFETGRMYWWGPNQQIFVLAGGRGGNWSVYPNTWQEGEDLTPLEPPPPLVAPIRGFGKVWRNNPVVSEALGWGERPESGLTGVYQRFERGTMLFSPAINGHDAQIYVLFADGSYAIYPDT